MYPCDRHACIGPKIYDCKHCRLNLNNKERRTSNKMTEFDKMIRLLDTSWPMRSQIVPCLVGPPGIGKTAAVMQHAKAHGCSKVVKIVASRCVPSETVGMTMPDHENRSMDIYNSMQLSSLKDGDILFLDELLEADQYVLSTLLTVIESREMADGTPLPDIQIVAATNDTIPPEQLKGNIRQRFMFMRFVVDKCQTITYIAEMTGIEVPNSVAAKLCEKGTDYNFLTPRSLTKLCLWVDSVDESKLSDVENVINEMWMSTIGSELVRARRERDQRLSSPEEQVRRKISDMVDSGIIPANVKEDNDLEDCSLAELLDVLSSLPDWERIKVILTNTKIEEVQDDEVEIKF